MSQPRRAISAARPDLALLPADGRLAALREAGFAGNFKAAEGLALCGAAGVPNLICHHYGMFAFNTADPSEIDAALAGEAPRAERARLQVEYALQVRALRAASEPRAGASMRQAPAGLSSPAQASLRV